DKHNSIESKFREEVIELEKKYLQQYKPLYAKRCEIIAGKVEPTDEESHREKEDDEAEEAEAAAAAADQGPVSGVPTFWLTALRNHPEISQTITDRDEDALKSLINIEFSYLDDNPGFKLVFTFAENEYFTNTVLEKTYFLVNSPDTAYGDVVYDRAEGTPITWKEGKDLSVTVEIKKQRHKASNKTRTVKKTVPAETFFSFFNPPKPPSEDDEEYDPAIDEKLEMDYEYGEIMKEKIIPHAVDWFTGKALEYEDQNYDDDYFGEEDDEELDDDEDDDDAPEATADRPEYEKYRPLLSLGWIFNRPMDNSDAQYRAFRGNLGILIPVGVGHVAISQLVTLITSNWSQSQTSPYPPRVIWSLIFSVIFISILNGFSGLLKTVLIASIGYLIGKQTGGSHWYTVLTGGFAIFAMFAVDWNRGFQFGSVPGIGMLDSMTGIQSRWWESLRFNVLRMISFNMDYRWRCLNGQHSQEMKERNENHRLNCPTCLAGQSCPKARVETSLRHDDYNYVNFLAHILYVPLYLAGPVITFNDFINQMRRRSNDLTLKKWIIGVIRWIGCFLLLEIIMHYCYIVAINKARAWKTFSALEIGVIGYLNLKHIWLKLLIMWRFFGLWAFADGVETVENMHRCMSNNYSASGFWRSWHRSYNRWIIRYIYIPLGGSKAYLFNTVVVFTFVAVWHDLDLNLLAWGWLVALFMIPEMLALKLFPEKSWGRWPYYRHLCGVGAVGNILLMISVNTVGFAGGLDGVKDMIPAIFSQKGAIFLIGTFMYLFSLSQIMFEIRAEEARQGLSSSRD
ncbi:glycerol transporter, partial [Blyttiomyces sp. JEL0837]